MFVNSSDAVDLELIDIDMKQSLENSNLSYCFSAYQKSTCFLVETIWSKRKTFNKVVIKIQNQIMTEYTKSSKNFDTAELHTENVKNFTIFVGHFNIYTGCGRFLVVKIYKRTKNERCFSNQG